MTAADAPMRDETWEEYAHRLEHRIKEQRDRLNDLADLRDGPRRKHKARVERLHRIIGLQAERLVEFDRDIRVLADRLVEAEGVPPFGVDTRTPEEYLADSHALYRAAAARAAKEGT